MIKEDYGENICLKYMSLDEFNSLPNTTRNGIRLIIESLDYAIEKLESPEISEISVNADGAIWAYGLLGEKGKELLGFTKPYGTPENVTHHENGHPYISNIDAGKAIKVLANFYGTQVHEERPILEVEVPYLGHRFSGIVPPCDYAPSFTMRSKATKIFTLQDYVNSKTITHSQMMSLREMISLRRNILVVGGTGSGKTTFCNALLHELDQLDPDCRVFIIEDVRELQCSVADKVTLLVPPVSISKGKAPEITTETQLRHSMRRSPDRIILGEVRDGQACSVLLSAWNSGHSGGMTTIHADDAEGGLRKIEQYLEMDGKKPNPRAIAATVHCIVSIQKASQADENGKMFKIRKVEQIVTVDEYIEDLDKYALGVL